MLDYCRNARSGYKKPDFTCYVEVERRRFDLFVVEVKKSGEPEGSDLVKLGKMMREMLVVLVERKIVQPVVFGMIMNGTFVAGFFNGIQLILYVLLMVDCLL